MVERSTEEASGPSPFDGDAPSHIGPFRILERIGEGGMGVVYLAERREPVEQRAALKVIRTDRLDKTYRARFAMEQKALARMDHPNIARLLDAGSTDGQSWFAMEYVPGTPLSDYCREHRLSIEARLELFVQVCDGVQHAHMKGILHRDLKPANVLVREIDGKPIAKIIDFGLAQPTDPLQIRATLHESMRQIVGTFAYMSPEQAQRTEGDLDTRTDVYSLGVVLYELLTGELPLDIAEAEKRGWAWFGEFLREHEPKKPSTRVSEMGEQLTVIAQERALAPHRLRARLRGDLDWVTMKALAADRQVRYPTVRDLGRDVQRFMRHVPVEAGPPGGWYVARKWVRRHSGTLTLCALLSLGCVIVIGVFTRMAAAARIAEVRRELVASAGQAEHLVEEGRHRLWPATAATVPLIDEWLLCVARVQAKHDQVVELLSQLAHDVATGSDPLLRFQLASLKRGAEALSLLDDLAERVRARRSRASNQWQATVGDHFESWQSAHQVLSNESWVAGVPLPLPGLVPIGLNRVSGCHEFYFPESAADSALPARRADGQWDVTASSGLIFALLPGGNIELPGGCSAAAQSRVSVAPVFMAIHEMTQAQWARLVKEVPGTAVETYEFVAGNDPDGLQRLAGKVGAPGPDPSLVTWDAPLWVHPVQQVSWEAAQKFLPRWNLRLPSAAEWWYACNGVQGAVTCSWVGEETGMRVNFGDATRLDALRIAGAPAEAWRFVRMDRSYDVADGFFHTCPVDALAPNPLGLFNMLGNVRELCRDGYFGCAPDDPNKTLLVPLASTTQRAVTVGGDFLSSWSLASFLRIHQIPTSNILDNVGVRPVFVYSGNDE